MTEELPFSQVPGRPTFRGTAVNAVALVPLLSTDKNGHEIDSHSQKSFLSLFDSLQRYSQGHHDSSSDADSNTSLDNVDIRNHDDSLENNSVQDLLLIIPNSQLTRPGDWRYDNTPLKNFHWAHGCQRLCLFDARPHCNRMAHDRLYNPTVTNDWIDIMPSRRTAAVIGVLNIRDVHSQQDLHRAEQELAQWAHRYSAPPYEVTFHGRSFARDEVVSRLFVFDSFEDSCRQVIDLTKTKLGSSCVAFPPSDSEHYQMMEMHLNVVVNDLAVAIFRQLEQKIKDSDALCKEKGGALPDARVKTHSLLKVDASTTAAASSSKNDEPVSKGGTNLSVANIANVVSPGNKLAAAGNSSSSSNAKKGNALKNMVESAGRAMHAVPNRRHSPTPQLLTPLDDVWDLSELNPRDAHAMKKRDMARREKLAADLSLLAGSPMDAYERYSRAAEMCKACPDPLWYAAALEGCASAHIAMAEAGGYNVDQYLEQNFVMPDDFMACAGNAPYSQDSRKQPAKQTLPSVVFALCEEALHIFNRHAKLAPLHAELLLKLAAYVANDDEAHLRCRWGEGEGCYGGDASDPRRWDRTSVSQLAFQELKGKDNEDLILSSTVTRCKMFTRLLHRAASTGGLAPLTRADVAATCTRLCLKGIVPTQWKNRPRTDRLPLYRKAAFFATVAAESISQCADMESTLQSSGLWLTACQFYSQSSNADGTMNYGWATLRASSLYSLSQQEDDKISSEAASEILLALLAEMAPDEIPKEKNDLRASLKALDAALQFDDRPVSGNSRHSTDATDDRSEADSISLSSRYSRSSASGKSMSFRSNFFPQQPSANASLLTVAQAKWADDEPITQVELPLPAVRQKHGSLSLNCVIPKINPQRCAAAQRGCLAHISSLRGDMPTISASSTDSNDPHYSFSLSGSPDKCEPIVPPPLVVVSVAVVPSESHLLLERYKASSKSANGGAMATFYNPYDKAKESDKKIVTTLVAVGEERELTVEFSNRLAVPLDVPSCHIEFECNNSERIKAPGLSFVIPPKAKKFAVQFPFLVLDADCSDRRGDDDSIGGGGDEPPLADMVDVKGLRVTCLSRSYFLSLRYHHETAERQVPYPASVYQRRLQYDSAHHEEMVKPRLEILQAQPQLIVRFAASETEVADGTTVPVPLSDGETFTLPSFRLNNDFGSTGSGTIERLQIIGVGFPGLSDDVLFDTDTVLDDSEKDVFFESYDEDSEKAMDSDAMVPLKMKVLSDDLTLASINDRSKNRGKGSIIKFQIVASHDLGTYGDKLGNLRLRIRYQGSSTDPAAEIWRKTEVRLKITFLNGPRISSLAFRPDLNWESAFSELRTVLAKQIADYDALKMEWKMTSDDATSEEPTKVQVATPGLIRVGLDAGVHVASGEVVLVLTVTNETDSTVVLSNRKGLVGGFEASPMPRVKIASGVRAKIPVVVPRIKRFNEEGNTMDFVGELVSQLGLEWETENDEPAIDSDVKTSSKMRQGRIRIPSSCLREIINDHPSFASRIGVPPVSIKVSAGRKASEKTLLCSPGTPVDTFVEAKIADWVPKDVAAKCRITLEFCAARKERKTERGSFVWCGLIRRNLCLNDTDLSHKARVVFLKDGEYVVSACARLINQDGNGSEETWFAPLAEAVVVETNENAAQ